MPRIKKSPYKRGNGTGSVYFDSTKGKHLVKGPARYELNADGKFHRITKQIGVADTHEDGLRILYKFLETYNPEVGYVEEKAYTFDEIYNMWLQTDQFNKLTKYSKENYISIYKKFSFLYKKPIHSIKCSDLEPFFELNKDTSGTLNTSKALLNNIFNLAIRKDLISDNPARLIKIHKPKSNMHKSIDLSDRQKLWDMYESEPEGTKTKQTLRIILVMMFTGMRVNELHKTLLENVHLDEGYFITGSKTTKDGRIIPIHPKIKDIVETIYNNSSDKKHLCEFNYVTSIERITIGNVNEILTPMGYKSHDLRVNFITLWKNQKLNDYIGDKIVGHTHKNAMDNVYFKPKFQELVEENLKLEIL